MKVEEILKIVGGNLYTKKSKTLQKIKIDSRKVEKGDIFIALKGKKFDGHDYIKAAASKKAGLIICEEKRDVNIPTIVVKDTYQALFDLASYYREKYHPLFVAITGSYGKTTTKEILYHILKSHYTVLKSPKNYNNHIGIPLTLFSLNEKHEIAILEMGMNHKGEIKNLSNLVKPDLAILTGIGTSHIGFLKGKKNIWKAKMEVTSGIEDGIVLVNGDDTYLKKVKSNSCYDVIKCGNHSTYGLIPYDIKASFNHLSFKLYYQEKEYLIHTKVTGAHFITNILLAIETSLLLNIKMEDIVSSLATYHMENQRMEVIKMPNFIVVNDSYNASFESMKALISFIEKQNVDPYFILGDMLELGSYSTRYHKKVANMLKKMKKKKVLLVGKETLVMKGKNFYHFSSNEEIISYLQKENLIGKTIVVKGSRGMHLEQIVNYLKEEF